MSTISRSERATMVERLTRERDCKERERNGQAQERREAEAEVERLRGKLNEIAHTYSLGGEPTDDGNHLRRQALDDLSSETSHV